MGIQFQKVNYAYKGFKTSFNALLDINLVIPSQGEIIGICGHTGSGKSTLVQHMNGLLEAQSGKTIIFDVALPNKKNIKKNHLRQRVGLVFQFPEYQLFEESIIKDIMFGPLNMKVSIDEARKKAEFAALSVGIDEKLWQQSPFRVSGGQMRRVAIAGILAMEPDIIVLDEPTRGLDPLGQKELMDQILDIHKKTNKTVIIISHDMDLISEYTNRVIVMKDAKILFDGSKNELFSNPQFEDFSLDYPATLKIMNHLHETISIPYQYVYTKDELLEYLNEVAHV
jgi:energy-coupling factor transport system ATP-binding protein